MNQRKGIVLVLLLLLLTSLTTSAVFAFDGRSGDLVEIKASETIDNDLYISGGQIVIDGTVKGDLFMVGRAAVINGVVEGDLFFGGQSLTINGEVKDDLRIGSATFTLGPNGKIGDDILAGGYSIETQAGSQIGGQLLLGASQALLAGTVAGDVDATVNGLQVEGSIGGNLNATTAGKGERLPFNPMQFTPNAPKVPTVASGLLIGPNASIVGVLKYASPTNQAIDAAKIKGGINFTTTVAAEQLTAQQQWLTVGQQTGQRALSRFLGALLIGIFLLWVMPAFMRRAATVLQGNLGSGIGWGLLNYLGLPIVLLVVLAIVVVISIGLNQLGQAWVGAGFVGATILTLLLILALFIFTIVLVGKVAAGVWLGRVLTMQRDPQQGRLLLPMLLGLLIISLLIALPYIGAIFNLIFSVLGLGAVWLALRGRNGAAKRKLHPYTLQ